MQIVADKEQEDDRDEMLSSVYHRIAFLTKAYREVMIMFYIDGLSTSEIAKRQNTSEGAVRQRLFSARQKIKSEVEEMKKTIIDLCYLKKSIMLFGEPVILLGDIPILFVPECFLNISYGSATKSL